MAQGRKRRSGTNIVIGGPVTNSAIGEGNKVTNNSITYAAPPAPTPGPTAPRPTPPRQDPVDGGPVAVEYDVAFSFAGEHRDYVERTKLACEALGLRVFYDKDKSNDWWGRNFLAEQRVVYGRLARYFVPFISVEYFSKPVPSDEFDAAMWTDVERGGGYILPVIIGAVRVPAHRLHPHTGYLRAEDHTPAQLAEQLRRKVTGAGTRERRKPRDITDIVWGALRDTAAPGEGDPRAD